VYLDKQNHVLYVGKAKNLKSRVSSYFANTIKLGGKTRVLVSQIEKIRITIVESELEALLLEAFYINKYNPKYNILMKDGKSYIKIRITIKDEYPKVLLARQEEQEDSLYFGPYPSTTAVKLVLKTIRRIFPFQSVPNHAKRICLYNHLGLCPCPPVFRSPELKKEYRKNIRGIIRMLNGESKKIMKELEEERDEMSKEEKYEEALKIQRKINALSIVTTPFHRPFEYDINPNLRTDLRKEELNGLMKILNHCHSEQSEESHTTQIKKLERIECYDISNTQGTNATGSMVVFINGEKESSQYRKFKIRRDYLLSSRTKQREVRDPLHTENRERDFSVRPNDKKEKPNDFAMMKEVLTRRLKHEDWHFPDLLIVDGGKGQVSSALVALAESGVSIPLIGLAKREETIIVPLKDSQFREISLPKNSPSLHLLMRIRDEAHRFAITYHRKLRSKQAIEQL
jgi:excinuclease ABC subunit C